MNVSQAKKEIKKNDREMLRRLQNRRRQLQLELFLSESGKKSMEEQLVRSLLKKKLGMD